MADTSGAEYVDLIFREIGKRDAIQAATEIKAAVDNMTEAEKRWAREDGEAARKAEASRRAIAAATHAATKASEDFARKQAQASQRMYAHLEGMKAAWNLAAAIFRGAFDAARRLGEYSSDLNREYEQLETAATGFWRAMADGVARGGGFTNFIDGLTESFTELTPTIREATTEASEFLDNVRNVVGAITNGALGNADWRGSMGGPRGPTPVGDDYDTNWGTLGEYANLPQSTQENLFFDQGDILPSNQTVLPQSFLGDQGVRSTGRQVERAQAGAAAAAREAQEAELDRLEDLKDALEKITEAYNEQTEANRAMREADWRMQEEDAAAEQEAVTEALAREEEAAQERSRLLKEGYELEEQYREEQERRSRQQVEDMESYGSSFVSVGSAIGNVFGQLAAREEEGSKEAEKYGKVQGGIMAAMAFVQSAIEYAAGVAAIGDYDYVGAASHFAAGIAYDIAGAMAIAQLGGDATPAATGAAGGAYVSGGSSSSEGGDSEPTYGANVTIYSMGSDSAHLGQQLERARWELERSNLDPNMVPSGGYE